MKHPEVEVKVESDHGRARLTLTAKDGSDEKLIAATLPRSTTEMVVRHLCRVAGLPEPWKKK